MLRVIRSDAFVEWLGALRDRAGAAKIRVQIERLAQGNPGKARPVGEGVRELKIHFGPGYRVYFSHHGEELIVILAGGDKSSQDRDIETAKSLWNEWKEQNDGQG